VLGVWSKEWWGDRRIDMRVVAQEWESGGLCAVEYEHRVEIYNVRFVMLHAEQRRRGVGMSLF